MQPFGGTELAARDTLQSRIEGPVQCPGASSSEHMATKQAACSDHQGCRWQVCAWMKSRVRHWGTGLRRRTCRHPTALPCPPSLEFLRWPPKCRRHSLHRSPTCSSRRTLRHHPEGMRSAISACQPSRTSAVFPVGMCLCAARVLRKSIGTPGSVRSVAARSSAFFTWHSFKRGTDRRIFHLANVQEGCKLLKAPCHARLLASKQNGNQFWDNCKPMLTFRCFRSNRQLLGLQSE